VSISSVTNTKGQSLLQLIFLFIQFVIAAAALLLGVFFWDEVDGAINEFFNLVTFGIGVLKFLSSFFYPVILLIPIGITAGLYLRFQEKLKVHSNYNNYFGRLALLHFIAAFFVSAFWGIDAVGLAEALAYSLSNFNWTLTAVIIVICWISCTANLRHISGLKSGFNTSLILSFCFLMYSWLKLDDGCTTVNSDPLFGGGGDIDCIEDYETEKDHFAKMGVNSGFNVEAFYAIRFLWMVFLSCIVISWYYWLRVKPHEQKNI
jgi:hypothetical protein